MGYKLGIKMMTTIPTGKYFTVVMNMFDPEQCDSLVVFSAGADEFLVLVLAEEEQEIKNVKEKRKNP